MRTLSGIICNPGGRKAPAISNSFHLELNVRTIFRVLGFYLLILWTAQTSAWSFGMDAYKPLLWNHLEQLCGFGPRNPGGEGHAKARAYIREIAERTADTWQEQEFEVETSDRKKLTLYNIELNFKGPITEAATSRSNGSCSRTGLSATSLSNSV